VCRGCGAGEEISLRVSCECEALVTLTHTYLGSFSLDHEDVRSLSLGEMCNFIEGIGTARIEHHSKGYKGPAKDPHLLGTKRF